MFKYKNKLSRTRNKLFYVSTGLDNIRYAGYSVKAILPGFFLSGAFFYNNFLLGIGGIVFADLLLYFVREKIFFDFKLQEIYEAGYKKWIKCWFHSNFTLSILLGMVFSFLYWIRMIELHEFMVCFGFFGVYSVLSGHALYYYTIYTREKIKNKF